jgi:hypothetical protein
MKFTNKYINQYFVKFANKTFKEASRRAGRGHRQLELLRHDEHGGPDMVIYPLTGMKGEGPYRRKSSCRMQTGGLEIGSREQECTHSQAIGGENPETLARHKTKQKLLP